MRKLSMQSILIAAASIAFAFPAFSQVVKEIPVPEKISCPSCRIEMVKLITIGAREGEGALSGHEGFHFAGKAGGWFAWTKEGLAYYDGSGKYMGRIGRQGKGPGEMMSVAAVLPARADSTYVLDGGLQTVHVLSPDRKYVRRFDARVDAIGVASLTDGRLVLGPGSMANLFSLVDTAGKTVRIFGRPKGAIPETPNLAWVKVARSSDGAIWSVHSGQYLIAKWDTSGRELLRIRPGMPWFPVEKTELDEFGRLRPMVVGIQEDSLGLLWIATMVKDKDIDKNYPGKEWLKANNKPDGQAELYDFIIDVIDPVAGQLLATHRMSFFPFSFVGPQQYVQWEESSDGVPRAAIWSFRLTGYKRK
jgi:hypothetical protein